MAKLLSDYIPEPFDREGIKQLSCGCVVERSADTSCWAGHKWLCIMDGCLHVINFSIAETEPEHQYLGFEESLWEQHICDGVISGVSDT